MVFGGDGIRTLPAATGSTLGHMPARSPRLTVAFVKDELPWWEATRTTGGTVRGGHMPIGRGVIPHDLAHFATEDHFVLQYGFWGLLARGATFTRGTDRRPTRPGRALVRDHRRDLGEAEHLGNEHHTRWRNGEPTPVAPTFDRLAERWKQLPDGAALTVEWRPTVDARMTSRVR